MKKIFRIKLVSWFDFFQITVTDRFVRNTLTERNYSIKAVNFTIFGAVSLILYHKALFSQCNIRFSYIECGLDLLLVANPKHAHFLQKQTSVAILHLDINLMDIVEKQVAIFIGQILEYADTE